MAKTVREEGQKLKVAFIGGGKLGLGHIAPLFDRSQTEITLFQRSYDKTDERDVKTVLHNCRHYFRYYTDKPAERELYEFDDVKTYGEADAAFWQEVNAIVVSVGVKNYQSTANCLAPLLSNRRNEEPVYLISFENDAFPAQRMKEMILRQRPGLGRRSFTIHTCDVAVDSMCNVQYEEATSSVVANGQRDCNDVFLPDCNDCKAVLERVFVINDSMTILPAEDEKSKTIMSLLEKKKAWFVNALDYIVAAKCLEQGRYVMSVTEEARNDVETFCAVAEKTLKALCSENSLDQRERDLILGPKSFLGECEFRKNETLNNIENEFDPDIEGSGRRCYTVLSDLGSHRGIYAYFDMDTKEFDDSGRSASSKSPGIGSNDEDSLAEWAKSSAIEYAMVEFGKVLDDAIVPEDASQNDPEGSSDDSPNELGSDVHTETDKLFHVDRKTIFNGALRCMAELYKKVNVASYMEKIRNRLVLIPPDTALKGGMVQGMPSAGHHVEDATAISSQELAAVYRILDSQLSVASMQMYQALNGVENALGERWDNAK